MNVSRYLQTYFEVYILSGFLIDSYKCLLVQFWQNLHYKVFLNRKKQIFTALIYQRKKYLCPGGARYGWILSQSKPSVHSSVRNARYRKVYRSRRNKRQFIQTWQEPCDIQVNKPALIINSTHLHSSGFFLSIWMAK